ncbi:Histone H1.2 [Ananas comosus]|uniref:Histone H1.2 n=1 Tax=Ananas comosus TaxID=4615 RepID=A0A199VZL9_ANACO|nr:Histone H1.2 [Ananas comosus]
MVVVAAAAPSPATTPPPRPRPRPRPDAAAVPPPPPLPPPTPPPPRPDSAARHPPYRDVRGILSELPPPSIEESFRYQMILAAIEALKERNGSSKRAISKFIRQTYGDASPQHDKNLAQNLRRMTREQVLRMVKRSYKIASSSSPQQPAANPKPRGRPRKNLVPLFVPIGTTVKLKTDPNPQNPPAAAKRRGRPPKALRTVGTVVRRKPGRPRKVQAAQAAAEKALIPVPVAAAVRKRGRPPKVAVAGLTRRPGRPRKADAAAAAAALMMERLRFGRRKTDRPPALGASGGPVGRGNCPGQLSWRRG